MDSSQSLSGASTGKGRLPPALLTRMSTCPSSALAAAASFLAASSCTRSCETGMMVPPAALASCTSSSSNSFRLATATTRTPSSASPLAIARPMPMLAPVTTAVLDLRSSSMSLNFPSVDNTRAVWLICASDCWARSVVLPRPSEAKQENTRPQAMVWNPQQYLKFSGHRLRPAVDLLMRIPDFAVESVPDLGAGAGNVTKLIKERWPAAAVVGVEGSAEMVAAGQKAAPEVEWLHQDLGSWRPRQQYDLIYSNAALHWLPDHGRLFPSLMEK